MGKGFDVDLKTLDRHASTVEAVAARVDRAAAAAEAVDLGGVGTYGLLCSTLVVPAFELFFADTVDIVDTLSEMGQAYAEAIRHQQQRYDQIEKHNHELFRRLGIAEP
jgi:hypothetical protein